MRLRDRLEHLEEELRKLREERERQERLEASRREVGVSHGDDGRPDPFGKKGWENASFKPIAASSYDR